ncbi:MULTISPECIES: hypothetical protein [Niastella]|uniref:DUF4142 domain-containing protein n=1 Tax=Niastella soli TaxID=2821487 RepID=A0ABS3YP38_9BACT|nr:hypothetical protein [Niastella soli]MBO9199637.1 hypothetical protein [Niastella soli]
MERKPLTIKTSLFLGLVVLIVLASCKSQDSTADINNVSDSARKVQDRVDSLRKTHYLNNDLSIIFLDVTSWIMNTQMALTRAEMAGNKKEMVDSLVINSPQGDTLYLTLRRMYEAGAVFAESYAQKDQYRAMREPDSSKLWLQKYFKGSTPTEALGKLQQFQHDATVINKIVRK